MRNLLIILILLASSAFTVLSFAEEKVVCIEFNGQQFCEAKTVISIGDTSIPIDDPFSLLDSLTSNNIEKVNLWDNYKYPKFLTELAKQLKMTEDQLIIALKDADANWKALHELTMKYSEIKSQLSLQSVGGFDIDKLFTKIITSIAEDIKSQLEKYKGTNI